MRKETMSILMVFVVFAIVLAGSALAASSTATINATVSIPLSCGILTSAGNVAFGSVGTGVTSSEQSVTVNNTGSASANFTISGTSWTNGSNTMPVGQTAFNTTTGTYTQKTTLTGVAQTLINSIANGGFFNLFLQMAVPNGQATGAYNQTITLTTTC